MEGLQQNQENRSNLALVNTGEVDGSASVFHLEIYDGETGLLAETVVTKPIPARRWHQINGILGSYAPETRQGYIRIEKVSGENPFLAYGVVNDGGAPGERSGDGAYLPARRSRGSAEVCYRELTYIDFIGSGRDSYSDFEASMRLETRAWVRVQRLRLVQKLGLVSTPSPASNK